MLLLRLKRLIRSIFGGWLDNLEDPELLLRQNLRDLNDHVPRMNESIALVRTNLSLLEAEKAQLLARSEQTQIRIRAALKLNRRELALEFASRLSEIEGSIETNGHQIEVARTAYEKALKVKQVFLRERERKHREAMEAIRAAERAKWQGKLADVLGSFEIAGIDQTHDEMMQKINENAARDRARLQVALDSSDTNSFQIEEELKRIQADEILRRFEDAPRQITDLDPSFPSHSETRIDLGSGPKSQPPVTQ